MSDLSELGKECIDDYKQQKASITEFKKALIEYVAFYANERPVVFFIDELDRCNPTFAVHVLERIKHLFDIPNIIFVLAVNKSQLQYAIEGYYGSSKMNSEEYMRRFIDVEYTLPEPSMEQYCRYLASQHDFNTFFDNPKINRVIPSITLSDFPRLWYCGNMLFPSVIGPAISCGKKLTKSA